MKKEEKSHPYKVRTRVTSDEMLSRSRAKERVVDEKRTKKTKTTSAATKSVAEDATMTSTKVKEVKKKSRDTKSLTKRVAKMLSGSSRAQPEADAAIHDVDSEPAHEIDESAAGVSKRDGDDVTELSKWPFNIRFVRTVSLKRKPFERGTPLRSSAPPFEGNGREVSAHALLVLYGAVVKEGMIC